MRDRGRILAGLALFAALLTFPVWYNLAARTTPAGPKLTLPATERLCVAPVAFMRTSHMSVLAAWRDQVVRLNARSIVTADGRTYEASLTRTCLRCHAAKSEFCDRCHTYAGVAPACWDCHVDPDLVRRTR